MCRLNPRHSAALRPCCPPRRAFDPRIGSDLSIDDGATIEVVLAAPQRVMTLKVAMPDGETQFYRVKAASTLAHFMTAVCYSQGLALSSATFLYDDIVLEKTSTPESLGMEDGDQIDLVVREPIINVKVVWDGETTYYKMKGSTLMSKLMNAFCLRRRISRDSVRFLFDGNFITASDTPSELDMKDADAIDVVRV